MNISPNTWMIYPTISWSLNLVSGGLKSYDLWPRRHYMRKVLILVSLSVFIFRPFSHPFPLSSVDVALVFCEIHIHTFFYLKTDSYRPVTFISRKLCRKLCRIKLMDQGINTEIYYIFKTGYIIETSKNFTFLVIALKRLTPIDSPIL